MEKILNEKADDYSIRIQLDGFMYINQGCSIIEINDSTIHEFVKTINSMTSDFKSGTVAVGKDVTFLRTDIKVLWSILAYFEMRNDSALSNYIVKQLPKIIEKIKTIRKG